MIITVSRQFGSGGREVGKRLGDELNLLYYDRELVTDIAEHTDLNESYVSSVLENGGFKNYAFTFGRSMPFVSPTPAPVTDVLVAQQRIIKAIGEKGNCVIVGRSADVILKDYKPFRIFVYADDDSKIARCRARAPETEHYTDKQMLKQFKEIDGGRKKLHDLLGVHPWGDKANYDMMINTTNLDIKAVIPALAEYIRQVTKK